MIRRTENQAGRVYCKGGFHKWRGRDLCSRGNRTEGRCRVDKAPGVPIGDDDDGHSKHANCIYTGTVRAEDESADKSGSRDSSSRLKLIVVHGQAQSVGQDREAGTIGISCYSIDETRKANRRPKCSLSKIINGCLSRSATVCNDYLRAVSTCPSKAGVNARWRGYCRYRVLPGIPNRKPPLTAIQSDQMDNDRAI